MMAIVSWLMLGMMAAPGNGSALQTLDPLRWENRIILVHRAEDVPGTIDVLRQADDGIVDRDIIWFVLAEDKVHTNYPGTLAPQFSTNLVSRYFQNEVHRAVLIGKDGGVKDECSRLDLNYLFYLIDQMPMRQQEMRS